MRALNALLTFTYSSSRFSHSLHRFNGIHRRQLHSSSPSIISFLHSQKGKAAAKGSFIGICTRPFCSLVDITSDYECNEVHDDDKAVEKDTALRLAISQVASEFGKESMLSMQRFFRSRYTPIVSTGSLKLDLALGIGGLPKGRMVEIYGSEASGKTTLALHVIKEAQKHGGYCAYVDVENAMDPSLAESVGVNTDNLLIARPNSAENLLNIVDTLTKSGSMEVIVVDSVAALVPQHEPDFDDGLFRDIQSQLMTKALRKILSSLCRSETLLIFVNQVRSKPNGGFGYASEVTSGGNALKFYAAVRMRIRRAGLIKDEDEVAGLSACIQIVKNKLAPSMKKVDLEIRFGRGIPHEAEVLEMGCEHGVILKRRNGYCIEGEILVNKQEAEEYLARNNEILNKVVTTLRSQLFVRNTVVLRSTSSCGTCCISSHDTSGRFLSLKFNKLEQIISNGVR